MSNHEIQLDGSDGEGGGQILRSALTLSLLTGKPFQIDNIRANRSKPGLRPQHLACVQAAALLGNARVEGAKIGARSLKFEPAPYTPSDLTLEIGTAGATALVLHTLHLAIAMRAPTAILVRLSGGTFNEHAPSFPFLQETWRSFQDLIGMRVGLSMPQAGFYPRGGGLLEAWIEPGQPQPLQLRERGSLIAIKVQAGVLNLPKNHVAERMLNSARDQFNAAGFGELCAFSTEEWSGAGQGAALTVTAVFGDAGSQNSTTATFVGLGAAGKPAELVASEAASELLAFLDQPGIVDPHSADQLLLPLSLAHGSSSFTTTEATQHLLTNARVITCFLDRVIKIEPTANPAKHVAVSIQ